MGFYFDLFVSLLMFLSLAFHTLPVKDYYYCFRVKILDCFPLHGGDLVVVEGLVCLKDKNGCTSGKYFTYQ